MKKNSYSKKLYSAMLIGCITISSLCGCGDEKSSADMEQTSSDKVSATNNIFDGELEKNVTIRVLENDIAIEKGYLAELIKAFNEKYKDYGITAEDANMDAYLDLANDGPYGYGPDILYQANDVIMKYVEGKHVYPLPVEQLECYDKIPKVAWDAYKVEVNGTSYMCGVPVNVQAPTLFYRKDLLPDDWETNWDDNKNGVPDMIETWNDMYAFSVERHKEDNNKYGYMKSMDDFYFASGFLFSYGGYIFGNNNTDTSDIGLASNGAEKGGWVLSQLSGVMNEECIDDTITTSAYSKLADGTYFATISTPDVYTTFLGELILAYENEGMTEDEARTKAEENLVVTTLPELPASGDLTEEDPELIDTKSMGGINGYGISAYTKYPNACLAFVDFATSYEMMVKRSEILGIAPAREDAAEAAGGTSERLYSDLASENIVLMPSINEVSQIWTPGKTFCSDLAKDTYRADKEKKYKDISAIKTGLEDMCQQIYDAIYTLK